MSTAARSSVRVALMGLLLMSAAGCAGAPRRTEATPFNQLRFGGHPAAAAQARPVVPQAPALRSRLAAPPLPAERLPVAPAVAEARVRSFLEHAGFALEGRPEGGGELVTATRMGPPAALAGEAVCALEALHRPTVASTELSVRLTPAPGGVDLQTAARFVEIDTKLLSGDLARQTCRSQGVLEAEVRRAALGG